ncbi:hypothetical protein ASPBRDRAFT_27868 [Aspergillus brasiliensis CBS 101740]|uniref:F-box domain-containing protein n=1 Tax=Aspergillus brasiliensis (strain CBS 101740 / IMI 381727 / IBT 21946) TaxID=767769 RepID=A0A1L9UT50_ASPBC|nr:hypothetical protein ASPBRDRAFT_27868 [Aspergillus brasiliensis CBS 101740]
MSIDSNTGPQDRDGMPLAVVERLLQFMSLDSRSALRLTCRPWCRAIDRIMPSQHPVANTVPADILLLIYYRLSPRDFENARRTCFQWMRASLDQRLLKYMLKRMGWWVSCLQDCQHSGLVSDEDGSFAWRLSKHFSTECLLSDRKENEGRSGFLTTAIVDFSQPQQHIKKPRRSSRNASTDFQLTPTQDAAITVFHVSNCGNYLLVASSRTIFVYRLLTRGADDNGAEVLAASVDASTPTLVVALLLRNRQAMVCELIPARGQRSYELRRIKYAMKIASQYFFHNLCSQDDPPRSVSICPGRRCVAFGSFSCLELRRYDPQINHDSRFQIPVWQPPEFLHFLPRRPELPGVYRIISSLADFGLAGCRCDYQISESKKCVFHRSPWGPVRDFRIRWAQDCRAIPISDGVHVLLIDELHNLCLGYGAPGTQTRIVDTIAFEHPAKLGRSTRRYPDPEVFAAGSDLTWGLRVVTAYDESGMAVGSFLPRDNSFDHQGSQEHRDIPVQNEDKDWEFLPGEDGPKYLLGIQSIYGKEIGQVDGVVELVVQSYNHSVRVWAFNEAGQTSVIDVDTFTSASRPAADFPYKITIGSDGDIASAGSDKNTSQAPPNPTRKRKHNYSLPEFGGQYSRARLLHDLITEEVKPSRLTELEADASKMSPWMYTTFVDLEIPESVSPGEDLCRMVDMN